MPAKLTRLLVNEVSAVSMGANADQADGDGGWMMMKQRGGPCPHNAGLAAEVREVLALDPDSEALAKAIDRLPDSYAKAEAQTAREQLRELRTLLQELGELTALEEAKRKSPFFRKAAEVPGRDVHLTPGERVSAPRRGGDPMEPSEEGINALLEQGKSIFAPAVKKPITSDTWS